MTTRRTVGRLCSFGGFFLFRFLLLRFGLLFGGFGRGCLGRCFAVALGRGTGIDGSYECADLQIIAFRGYVFEYPGGFGGKFESCFVRFKLTDGFVQFNVIAFFLKPLGKGYFGDGFSDDGYFQFNDAHNAQIRMTGFRPA